MRKEQNKRREKDNEAKVVLKNLRTSPQKLNLVLQMIRRKKADKAISILQFSRKRISKDVEKALRSVISNAENNHQFDIDNLFVKEAYVGKSIVMKRFRPRAKGRAAARAGPGAPPGGTRTRPPSRAVSAVRVIRTASARC